MGRGLLPRHGGKQGKSRKQNKRRKENRGNSAEAQSLAEVQNRETKEENLEENQAAADALGYGFRSGGGG